MHVAVVGLGNMGGRIAARLASLGHRVAGLDARPGRAAEWGVEALPDLAAASRAEIVLLSLPSSREVESVVRGPGGLLEHARASLTVVDLTTAEPASTRMLHAELAARGVALLDAGISGGPGPAADGTLTLMVGGDAAALERALPVLSGAGSKIIHLGASGNGHAAKAVNNFLNAMNLAATAEAMVAGVAAGLDAAQLLEVIQASSGRNFATEVRFPRILQGDYQDGALSSALMVKDLDVYAALAASVGAPASLAPAARAVYELALEQGLGDQGANRVADVVGDLAGGIRLRARDAG
jgi:3-hydroxyisobutyrate dehydrogenase